MQATNKILLTQSFVMDKPGSYWDYRDYIFSLCSNPAFTNQPVRLNVERGTEWVTEMREATIAHGFTNCRITKEKPKSWSSYMIRQIDSNPTTWTMPFPGDHIYIENESSIFENYLKLGEEKGVDAISFGHIQDWDYLLDWRRIDVLENNDEYVIIKWGHKYRYCKNFTFSNIAKSKINLFLMMAPVPGFMIFKSPFLKQILEAVPYANRWQDMEYSNASVAWSYSVLIPKEYLYRHVHGYWTEQAFEILTGRALKVKDTRATLDTMYIRTEYNWKLDTPDRIKYRTECLSRTNTMRKYLEKKPKYLPKVYSPFFNSTFSTKKSFLRRIYNILLLYFIDYPKKIARNILYPTRN